MSIPSWQKLAFWHDWSTLHCTLQTYEHIIWRTWITIKLVENPWSREKDINVSQWKFIYLTKINQETLAEYICRAWLSKMVSFIWKCNRMCLSVCSVRSCWPQNRYDYPLLWIVLLVQVRFITILSLHPTRTNLP